MLPFVLDNASMYKIKPGDYIYIEGIKSFLEGDGETIDALLISGEKKTEIRLSLPAITREEREIILSGSLINYYARQNNG